MIHHDSYSQSKLHKGLELLYLSISCGRTSKTQILKTLHMKLVQYCHDNEFQDLVQRYPFPRLAVDMNPKIGSSNSLGWGVFCPPNCFSGTLEFKCNSTFHERYKNNTCVWTGSCVSITNWSVQSTSSYILCIHCPIYLVFAANHWYEM